MGAALSLLATILALGIVLVIPERRFAQFLYSAALLAALVFLGVLPQHPANSVSQLAIGNALQPRISPLLSFLFSAD